jgi:hypothetical protein
MATRYQRGNQKSLIEEAQTIQRPQDTKGVIRSRKSRHCMFCPSSIYDFWLSLWFLVAIVLSVFPGFTTYDYPFGILWPLHCLSSFDLRLLVTLLVSCGHCIVCPSSIYDFWLPFWYPVAIVLSVIPRFTTSDYPFGIFWSFLQWPQDTKRVIRSRKSRKDRQYNGHKIPKR